MPAQVDVDQRRHQVDRGRTLHGDHGRFQRQVADRHAVRPAAGAAAARRRSSSRFEALTTIMMRERHRRSLQVIDQHVVQDAALLVGDQRVADLARLHVGHAPRHQAIEEGEGSVAHRIAGGPCARCRTRRRPCAWPRARRRSSRTAPASPNPRNRPGGRACEPCHGCSGVFFSNASAMVLHTPDAQPPHHRRVLRHREATRPRSAGAAGCGRQRCQDARTIRRVS